MTDDELMVWIWVMVAMVLWIAKLKWSNRKLRKKLALAVEPVPAALPIAQPVLTATPTPEVERLRARIEVLERIATDGNHSLDREIEALRRA